MVYVVDVNDRPLMPCENVSGRSYMNTWSEKLVPEEDAMDDEDFKWRYQSYSQWYDKNLDFFEKEFITPSGDKMVAFGQYGYDG